MSNKKQETIADIVREMRQRFEPYAKSDSNDARYVAYLGYAEFADRIDAAHKREREAGAEAAQICGEIGEMVGREAACDKSSQVGNAAAMREALEQAKRVFHCAIVSDILKGEDARKAFNAVTAALSAQQRQRNCDVGTAEEQSDRFDKFCYSHNKCFQCPVKSIYNSHNRQKQLREIIRCEIIWSQMPYEEVK